MKYRYLLTTTYILEISVLPVSEKKNWKNLLISIFVKGVIKNHIVKTSTFPFQGKDDIVKILKIGSVPSPWSLSLGELQLWYRGVAQSSNWRKLPFFNSENSRIFYILFTFDRSVNFLEKRVYSRGWLPVFKIEGVRDNYSKQILFLNQFWIIWSFLSNFGV